MARNSVHILREGGEVEETTPWSHNDTKQDGGRGPRGKLGPRGGGGILVNVEGKDCVDLSLRHLPLLNHHHVLHSPEILFCLVPHPHCNIMKCVGSECASMCRPKDDSQKCLWNEKIRVGPGLRTCDKILEHGVEVHFDLPHGVRARHCPLPHHCDVKFAELGLDTCEEVVEGEVVVGAEVVRDLVQVPRHILGQQSEIQCRLQQ